jgi:NADH-quinone oxidoreductase subunit A
VADYLPILTMVILATLFVALTFVGSAVARPSRPTPAKSAPYECGIVPTREPAERFPVRFYLVAMIFIIFDIEIIFLFPWAVIYRQLGAFGLWEMLAFAVTVFLSFVFLLGRGALNWGPTKHLAPMADRSPEGDARSAERSTESTIRRVSQVTVGEVGRLPVGADRGER